MLQSIILSFRKHYLICSLLCINRTVPFLAGGARALRNDYEARGGKPEAGPEGEESPRRGSAALPFAQTEIRKAGGGRSTMSIERIAGRDSRQGQAASEAETVLRNGISRGTQEFCYATRTMLLRSTFRIGNNNFRADVTRFA